MYCKNCGTKIDDEAAFCKECGTPVNKNSQKPKNINKTSYLSADVSTHETTNTSQNYMSKLNMSVELIRKRNKLTDDIKKLEIELESMKNLLGIKAFLKQNPDKKSQFHGLSIIFYVFAVIIFLLVGIIGVLIIIVFLCLGLFLSIVASFRDKSKYEKYKWEEHQKYQKKYNEYEKMYNELVQLDKTISNPNVCVIPRSYWAKADIIYTYIVSGAAQSVEEAIAQLGL